MMLYAIPKNEIIIGGKRIFTLYGFFIALGIVCALLLTCWIAKKKKKSTDDLFVLALFVLPLALLGAKIYYCLFSAESFNFVDIFKIWEPGLAVYGSILGGVLGGLIYSLIFKKNLLEVMDLVMPGLLLGQAIGRIGCFCAGCCYGIESANGFKFFPISVLIDGEWHYATFFYESLWNLIGCVLLTYLSFKFERTGSETASYMIWYGFGRGLIEGIRGDSLYIGSTGIKVSQALSFALMCLGIAILAINIYKKRKENNGQKI